MDDMIDTRNDGNRDMVQAVSALAERLPNPLAALASLAFNYRWSWMPAGADLFQQIDPELWTHSQCNPRELLEAVAPARLRDLATDSGFLERLNTLAKACNADLQRPNPWSINPERPVAYFCAEFGFHCSMAVYSGGLGILAGNGQHDERRFGQLAVRVQF